MTPDIIPWGRELVRTEDHDPIYTAMWRMRTRPARVRRALFAYWCTYSVGFAWWVSGHEGAAFWDWMDQAAHDETPNPVNGGRWPRVKERRYWRGQKAVNCVRVMRERYPSPEDAIGSVEALPAPLTLERVDRAVQEWPMFGPWSGFNAADMIDRCLGTRIQFPTDVRVLFDAPRKGAAEVMGQLGVSTPQGSVDKLLAEFAGMNAPPQYDRPLNLQEVETILCKYRAFRNGHYFIGSDTIDDKKYLGEWGGAELAEVYP